MWLNRRVPLRNSRSRLNKRKRRMRIPRSWRKTCKPRLTSAMMKRRVDISRAWKTATKALSPSGDDSVT
ncbi:hypothetical protein EMPG_13265 [Blastomyces silverae]|uniref:Uncharacterized protein n=1 Tax=Blastomyces silverae TaxID=2060906 RepID=A0A0H1BJ40_9EURO|nr:hypothetical protein EMPG_13265 [Blastomyces silverae]